MSWLQRALIGMGLMKSDSALYTRHPELEDRIHVLSMSSEDQVAMSGGSEFKRNANSYTQYMWLQRAISILANNIGTLPLRIAKDTQDDTEYPKGHWLNGVLDNPNSDMSPEDLWKQWITDLMLGGEIGFEVVKNGRGMPLELWPRQPDIFSVRVSSVRYRKIAGYRIDDGDGAPYLLAPEEFIHTKFYNPLQPFRGIAPTSAIRLSIDIDQLSQAWSKLFFKNNARPDFAVIAPEGVTKTEKEEMKVMLRADHRLERAHEPIILENGITDIKTFSWAAKDLEWVSQREMSRDEVAAIVGVPDEIMGYGRDTYENFDTAERILWTVTIVPLVGFRDGVMTRYFRKIGTLQPDERIETDLRNVSPLQEDKTEKITQVRTLFEMGVPVNQAAAFIGLGLDPIVGGDVGYLSSSMVPIDKLPIMGSMGGGLLLEAKPQDTKETQAEKKLVKLDTQYGDEQHAAIYKRLQARLDNPVADLQRIVKKELQRQQNEVSQKLRDSKQYGRGKYKADIERLPNPEDLFNLEEEIKLWVAAMKKRIFAAVASIGAAELIDLGISTVFDIDRPEVVRQVNYILNTVAKRTNTTTWNNLIDLFREAESAGEGIVAIQERLSTYFGDRKSDYQTERIARTTMTGASNSGQQQAWQQAEADGVQMNKQWISALQPERTREAHAAAHGQEVGLHEYFVVDGEQMEYPGDPNGSPGNVINCLCGMIGNIKD